MNRGYIDPTGIAILPAFIKFPRLSLSGSVRFLVETGSPASVISPADAENLGIHHSVLQGRRGEISGFGGKCEVVLEDGILSHGIRFWGMGAIPRSRSGRSGSPSETLGTT